MTNESFDYSSLSIEIDIDRIKTETIKKLKQTLEPILDELFGDFDVPYYEMDVRAYNETE